MRAGIWLTLCLTGAQLAAQSTPNAEFRETAVIPSFRRVNPDVVHFTTIDRRPVSPALDLAVVRAGAPHDAYPQAGDIRWIGPDDLLGVFLLTRDDPAVVYEITIDSGAGEAGGLVETVWSDSNAVVLKRTGDYGFEQPRLKYLFDIRTKSLTDRRECQAGGSVFTDSTDRVQLLAVSSSPVERAASSGGWSPCGPRMHFGPDDRFELVPPRPGWSDPPGCVIRTAERSFAPPRSSAAEWLAARPRAVGRFGDLAQAEVLAVVDPTESVGSVHLYEGRLWFGLTYYDG